ncbi:m repeat, partial [Trichoderma arundinaceum]
MAQSRWGSFLQQAVAGVESRLDNILAESDDDRSAAQLTAAAAAATTASPKVASS